MVEVDIHVRGLEGTAAAQSGTHLGQSLSLFNSTTQSLSFYLEPALEGPCIVVYKGPVQFIHYQHSCSLYMS